MLASASFGMLLFAEEGGFAPLFDGKSLSGWEQQGKVFSVKGEGKDAEIVAGSLESSIAHNEFLCTTKDMPILNCGSKPSLRERAKTQAFSFAVNASRSTMR